MRTLEASTPMNGVWTGGLEGKREEGVDIFFDNGKIEIGVHDGLSGTKRRITRYQALWLAGLLTRAANEPPHSKKDAAPTSARVPDASESEE